MSQSFDTILLSASKTGYPELGGTSLSAFGVNTQSLSTLDKGIAFNKKDALNAAVTTVTVEGSKFKIDTAYHQETMALVKVPVNDIATYTVFTYSSAGAPTIDQTGETSVSSPETRRLYLLGIK